MCRKWSVNNSYHRYFQYAELYHPTTDIYQYGVRGFMFSGAKFHSLACKKKLIGHITDSDKQEI